MGLNWESTYELALALRHAHGDAELESVTLDQLLEWIVALTEFADEVSLCNDEILQSILQEWYEVTINV